MAPASVVRASKQVKEGRVLGSFDDITFILRFFSFFLSCFDFSQRRRCYCVWVELLSYIYKR